MRRLSVLHVGFPRRYRLAAWHAGVEASNWSGRRAGPYPGHVASADHLPQIGQGQQAAQPGRGAGVRRPHREQATTDQLDAERGAAGLEHEVAGLRRALDTRNIIGQAQGILIERHGTDSDGAFEMLVRISQQSHLKLHDVARRLVETTVREKRAGK